MKTTNVVIISMTMVILSVVLASAQGLDSHNNETVSMRAFAQLVYRVQELERKVAGMQKQITILHAKKADRSTGASK